MTLRRPDGPSTRTCLYDVLKVLFLPPSVFHPLLTLDRPTISTRHSGHSLLSVRDGTNDLPTEMLKFARRVADCWRFTGSEQTSSTPQPIRVKTWTTPFFSMCRYFEGPVKRGLVPVGTLDESRPAKSSKTRRIVDEEKIVVHVVVHVNLSFRKERFRV